MNFVLEVNLNIYNNENITLVFLFFVRSNRRKVLTNARVSDFSRLEKSILIKKDRNS